MSGVADVYTFLETQGLAGGVTGWDLLRRRVMDTPSLDQSVVVLEDGGFEPELPADEGIGDSALGDPGVIVQVRGKAWDGDASFAKAQAILAALHGLRNVALGGSGADVYLRVRAMTSEPVFAGFDDQGRPMHTVGLRLLKLL